MVFYKVRIIDEFGKGYVRSFVCPVATIIACKMPAIGAERTRTRIAILTGRYQSECSGMPCIGVRVNACLMPCNCMDSEVVSR